MVSINIELEIYIGSIKILMNYLLLYFVAKWLKARGWLSLCVLLSLVDLVIYSLLGFI